MTPRGRIGLTLGEFLLLLGLFAAVTVVATHRRTAETPVPSPAAEASPSPAAPAEASANIPERIPGDITTAALGGLATWYCGDGSPCTAGYGPGDLVAAIDPSLGIEKGERLVVRYESRTVTVRVVDVCACGGDRIIDLTRLAFSQLADPAVGQIPVSIEFGGVPTLPATDLP